MKVEELVSYGLSREYIDILKARGINELNPVQEEAVKKGGLFTNRNMLIVSPTASGKTLIGEIAIVRAVESGLKGVYLLPLRAIANEKYTEFKVLESLGFRIGISTGDYDSPAEELEDKDIIVATYERFDSLLRIKPFWMRKVGIVVIDELHTINDPERGPIIEMIVARLKKIQTRIIGLSATIGNPQELAEWLDASLVNIDWRPVKLREGFYDKRAGSIVFADGGFEDVEEEFGERIMDLVAHSARKGLQTLVFVHNRRRVEELALEVSRVGLFKHVELDDAIHSMLAESPSRLEREKLLSLVSRGVAYHHAGLSLQARRAVEEAFRRRFVNVVFATPTLAAGVNLPARRVIVSVKRYDPTSSKTVSIPVFEYKQMAGRAGRPRYDDIGEAIIADAKSREEALKYIKSPPENVQSKISSERSLRIHTLSLIASNDASSLEDVLNIFGSTLGSLQYGGSNLFSQNVEKILEFLASTNMVEKTSSGLKPTRLGKLTSYTYLDPLTVYYYLSYKPSEPDELDLLHIVTTTVDYARSRPFIPSDIIEVYEEQAFQSGLFRRIGAGRLREVDIENIIVGYVHALILRDWINEVDEDRIISKYEIGSGDLYTMRETATWITSSLAKIERLLGDIVFYQKLNKLSMRIDHGVREDALELVKLRGIGRVRARILISHGIRSLRDLSATPKSRLASLPGFGRKLVESISEELKSMGFNEPPD
ncbi:DEAD/DEAH box helicase [Thermogladius sp. 4427co]|uniref:DEAD/DEAH box helicase n=1 Tax=Thermogladius sp. 4427co TaxID=3450718 RepID=UPI003F795FD8